MKNIRPFAIASILFLSLLIVSSACKKDSDEPAPSAPKFVMSSIIDPQDLTKVYFQFTCTTDDVKLTKLVVKNPLGTVNDTYDLQGTSFLKDVVYEFPISYTKSSGTWKFEFTGNRQKDNSGFVSNSELVLSK